MLSVVAPTIRLMTVTPPPSSGGWAAPAIPAAVLTAPVQPRRGWRLSGSVWIAIVCSVLVIAAGGQHGGDTSTFPPAIKVLAYVGAFPMIGVSVLLVWRHRWPVLIAALATGLTLIVPTSPLPALVALAALTAARTGWMRWGMIVATFVATMVAFSWDIASHTSQFSALAGSPAEGTPARLALFWAMPALAAVVTAAFAAFGITRRLRAERDSARRGSAAAARTVSVLHQEVERERERQELARELHDTLAARLSALSLHAGALELTVGEADERAMAAAKAVRQSAQHSLDDLRHVVKVLRQPEGVAASTTGLSDLSALIDQSLREGTDVRAQVLVSDPGTCDARVAHACYRLLQEAISNVRRHAPAAALYIDVRGGPQTGLTLSAVNWLPPAGSSPITRGGGHGLTGMSERATLLGGTFQAGSTPEGSFAVAAWLPWVPR